MIVQHFLKWIDTARVADRAAAANALARAYIVSDLDFEDRCAAEAALTLLLDDPSPKVRLAMAEALKLSPRAPQQIVAALAADQPEVAAPLLALSPVLGDNDLIDLVAASSAAAQGLIASRARVSMALSAAIAEVGEPDACVALLHNPGAEIASVSFRRIAERQGGLAPVREALVTHPALPSETRHALVISLGEVLTTSPLVTALMGKARAERLMREACTRASLTLIDGTRQVEFAALVEHLRMRGDLTTGFLVRVIAHGKIDFFGAALVALSGQPESRVRALLSGGRDTALSALFRAAKLPAGTHASVLRALSVWREVARGKRVAGAQEVSYMMLRCLQDARGEAVDPVDCGGLANLIKSIHLEALRENARGHALAIAAA